MQSFPKGLVGVLMFKKRVEDHTILEKEIENIIAKINWFLSKKYFFPKKAKLRVLSYLFTIW